LSKVIKKMKLFNILAATVAASPLNCDVANMFSDTCSTTGFMLGMGSLSSECSQLVNTAGMQVFVIAPDGGVPGSSLQLASGCNGNSLSASYSLDLLSESANCWTSTATTDQSGKAAIEISADVYIVDADNNRPFNKIEMSCTIGTSLTVNALTYTVTDSGETGPEDTAVTAALEVKAYRDGVVDTSLAYPVGSNVFFYVEPPTGMHSSFTMSGSCANGIDIISPAWTYGLDNSDCSVTSSTFTSGTIGACMRIFASSDATTTVACVATLSLA